MNSPDVEQTPVYEPPVVLAALAPEDAAALVPADLSPHVHAAQNS